MILRIPRCSFGKGGPIKADPEAATCEQVETGIITSGKATRVVEIYNEDWPPVPTYSTAVALSFLVRRDCDFLGGRK